MTRCVAQQDSQPRGVIEVNKCLSIKGAEDRVNKAHAFEISTVEESMFFIADSDKVRQANLHSYDLRRNEEAAILDIWT